MPAELDPNADLAMMRAAERSHPMMGLVAVMALHPPPGLTVSVDWPVFLGRSEEEILDLLTDYYTGRLKADVRTFLNAAWHEGDGWESQISRDLYRYMARSAPEVARWQAERTWAHFGNQSSPRPAA